VELVSILVHAQRGIDHTLGLRGRVDLRLALDVLVAVDATDLVVAVARLDFDGNVSLGSVANDGEPPLLAVPLRSRRAPR